MALLVQTAPSHSSTTDKQTKALDYGATNGSPTPATSKSNAGSKETMVTYRASAAATAAAAAKLSVEDSDEEDRKTLLDKQALTRTKDLALTVLERYRNATSTKMYDVEELIDYYFHRRLAAVTAVIISYLPFVITPNQITIFGLGLGWASALCLYDSEFHYPLAWEANHSLLAASLFMFFWIVSDCADGQVARLCKRGTRTGRILDGVVDGLVIAPNIFIMSMMCANRWGEPYFAISMASGFSLWAHAIIYDKIKNTYMENALPQSECDGETVESVKKEFLEAKAKDPFALDSVLLGIYVVYMKVQATLTSDAASKAEATRFVMLAKCNDQYRASYIKKYNHVVRLASFMGISAHVSALYVAYFAAIYVWEALFVVQMYFLILQNAIMVLSLYLYSSSGMATQQPLNTAL